ncbi:DNA starvation/stationary phase protection protein, partial [Erysipelotrichaceae bacterium OttesenSCG-928-M19]|nr:DNA starvation/stationary phase protection protein [Erysipelotrichaceae bacterium OttesenSCG-928-M19]
MARNELLQSLLADLMKINVNIHSLHWNIQDESFMEYHELTEELYEDLFEKYDDVAEYLKMNDVFPIISLAEYDKLSEVEYYELKKFNKAEVIDKMIAAYEYLIGKFSAIREDANNRDEFLLANKMEDYIGEYSKNLWML